MKVVGKIVMVVGVIAAIAAGVGIFTWKKYNE